MKRSEMVDIIYHELMPLGLEFGSDEDEFLKWQADNLLTTLEKCGMLPPVRERTEEEIKNPRYDSINMAKYIRDWAEENE